MSTWPAPARDAAFHGVAGEFVTRTAPHTESDPMALLIQFLVSFGAAAGRNVHYPVEATHHHLNENAILIGPSGKGRKGSAWDHVEALIREIDHGFAKQCISSGLASGEGLILRGPRPCRRRQRRQRQAAADHRVRVRADPEGAGTRGQHAFAGRAQRVGRKAPADDRQERAGARDRRARRDHRSHHQRNGGFILLLLAMCFGFCLEGGRSS